MMRWLSVLFILIVALSAWVLFSNYAPKTKGGEPTILDGYMTEAHYTQYDNQGQVHMTMYSPQVSHYAKDNTSYFDKPKVLAYSEERVPWTIQSLHGKSIHDGQQVDLWGEVKIHQDPQTRYPETTITTTAMTIYPHRAYAETNQPVTIARPDTHIDAVGMQADFKAGIFKLLSTVRGSYEPAPAPSHH